MWSASASPCGHELATRAAGACRDIAGLALEIAAVVAGDDFKADRNTVEPVVEWAYFGLLGLASVAAAGAPENFNPHGVGHGESMRANLS